MKFTKKQEIEIPLLEKERTSHVKLDFSRNQSKPNKFATSLPKYLDFGTINSFFFLWVTSIVKLGNRKTFQQDQHYDLRETENSKWIAENFAKEWDQVHQKKHPLLWTQYQVFKSDVLVTQILAMFQTCFDFTGPILVSRIITFVGVSDSSILEGFLLVILFVVARLGVIMLNAQIIQLVTILTNKVIAGTRTLMYRKFLRFPLMRNQKYSSGIIMNHMLIDVENLSKICFHLPSLMQFPIIVLTGIYMIYQAIGLAFIGGIFSVIFISSIVSIITKILFK